MMKTKRSISMFLVCVMMLLSAGGFVPAQITASEGTAIRNEKELRSISEEGVYYLANDITLTQEWTTLGSFRGTFDGKGHKISGLTITKGYLNNFGTSQYGLFSEIASGGSVKNLGLEGTVTIKDVTADTEWISAGLLAGTISNNYYNPTKEARIANVWVKGEVKSETSFSGQSIGGLTGVYNEGIAKNIYSAVKGVPLAGSVVSVTQLSNMFYDSTLYTGESSDSILPKTTNEMKSDEFLALLNANADGVEWVQGTDGYPVMKTTESDTAEPPAEDEEETVIEIHDETGLRAMKDNLSADYRLTSNIELTSLWTMIGDITQPFTGTLDGDGYVISGLDYSGDAKYIGLIGNLTGTVKNLAVEGNFVATSWKVDAIGGIAGLNTGTIENCYAKLDVTNYKASRTGAIAGDNMKGTIRNCYGVPTGSVGPIAIGAGTYDNVLFDQTVYGTPFERYGELGKTTEEMKSASVLSLLNSKKGTNRTWVMGADGYPALRYPRITVSIDETKLKENIAAQYYSSTDPWAIIDLLGYGKKDALTKESEFIKEAVAAIKDKDGYSYATTLEKYIIALSGLGLDAAKLSDGTGYVNAIASLGEIDFSKAAVNSIIFAICAYDSGEYATEKGALQTKEELLQLLLNQQKTDGGWTFMGQTGDVDLTSMALHALSTCYLAKDAESAGVSQDLYTKVNTAVERGITFLSDIQADDGTFQSYGSANANTIATAITALSALGINADTDERFVKDGGSAYHALLKFASPDLDGFLWVLTDKKVNGMATEQSFRALASFERVRESNQAFNIYSFGKRISIETPTPTQTPVVKPTQTPVVKPTQTPVVKPTQTPVVKPTQTPVVKPTPTPVTKPAKVTSLKMKSQTTTGVSLTWKKQSGVKGYEIYVYDTKARKYVCVKTLTSNTAAYTVTKVSNRKLLTGTSYKVKVLAYKQTSTGKLRGSSSSVLTVSTKPKAPVLKVKTGVKKAVLSWNKVTGASGYEVYMSTNKKSGYKKVLTTKKGTTVKYTKGKLKSKKTYYFKVRTYKVVNGEKITSAYSTVKSVRVK